MSKSPSHERHKWFHDDTEGALKEIRRILSQVSQRLVIVDPYFSSTDVLRLLPWVARRMLTIELLTSSAGLAKMRSRSLENVGVEDSGDKKLIDVEWESKNLQELVEVYHQARFAQKVNLAEIRVMRGRRSPIHDRIIVADSTVWHLGSSLNEFGHRGTMLSNVGEHHDVMDTIVRVWDKSAPIQSRIDELASSLPHRKDRPSDEVR